MAISTWLGSRTPTTTKPIDWESILRNAYYSGYQPTEQEKEGLEKYWASIGLTSRATPGAGPTPTPTPTSTPTGQTTPWLGQSVQTTSPGLKPGYTIDEYGNIIPSNLVGKPYASIPQMSVAPTEPQQGAIVNWQGKQIPGTMAGATFTPAKGPTMAESGDLDELNIIMGGGTLGQSQPETTPEEQKPIFWIDPEKGIRYRASGFDVMGNITDWTPETTTPGGMTEYERQSLVSQSFEAVAGREFQAKQTELTRQFQLAQNKADRLADDARQAAADAAAASRQEDQQAFLAEESRLTREAQIAQNEADRIAARWWQEQQLGLERERLAQEQKQFEVENPNVVQGWVSAIWGLPEGTQLSPGNPLPPINRQTYDQLPAGAKQAYANMIRSGVASMPTWWSGAPSTQQTGTSWLGRRAAFRQY